MESISVILFALFVGVCSYFIGLHRGNSNNKYEYDRGYDDGWLAAEEYFKQRFLEGFEVEDPDRTRYDKARELLRQLDDLFFYDDENNEEQLEE